MQRLSVRKVVCAFVVCGAVLSAIGVLLTIFLNVLSEGRPPFTAQTRGMIRNVGACLFLGGALLSVCALVALWRVDVKARKRIDEKEDIPPMHG